MQHDVMRFQGLWRDQRRLLIAAALLLAGVVAVCAVMPTAAIGLAIAVPLIVMMAAWPNGVAVAVVFLLYINAAVIAVKFHNVPFVVGVAIPGLLLIPLAYQVLVRRCRIVIDPVLPCIAIFLVAQLVATLFSAHPRESLTEVTTTLIEGVGIYLLLTNTLRTRESVRQATWALLAAGAFMGGLSFVQYTTRTYSHQYGGFAQTDNAAFRVQLDKESRSSVQRRLAGPIGEQNRYAQIMLMLVPLGVCLFSIESQRIARIAAGIATFFIVMGMALSFSRGALIALPILLAVMVCLRWLRSAHLITMAAGLMLLLIAVPQVRARMASLLPMAGAFDRAGFAAVDGSLRSRVAENLAAAMIFADHPIHGVGPGMYPYHYHEYAKAVAGSIPELRVKAEKRKPHILYLGLAAELGLFGLFSYLTAVFVLFRNLTTARQKSWDGERFLANLATAYLLAIVAYLLAGLFLHFSYVRYFWLMMAIAGAVARIAHERSVTSPVPTPALGV